MEQSKENPNLQRSNDFRNVNSKGKNKKLYLPNMTQPNNKKKPNENTEFQGAFLHSAKFDKWHGENEKIVTFMKDKVKWQKYRKEKNPVSNRLDGSYSTKYNNREWYPNGEYIVKRRYNYLDSGLEHFYEKCNVPEKKPIDAQLTKKEDSYYMQDFLEYGKIGEGEYIISIEYCSSCEEHSNITQHSSDTIFKDLALNYQRIIKERFPFIAVILKPINVDIVSNEKFKLPRVDINGGAYTNNRPINDHFKPCRIGAFEIQISTIKNGLKDTRLIHSKLKTKKFPNVKTVLDKIVSMMPLFNFYTIHFI